MEVFFFFLVVKDLWEIMLNHRITRAGSTAFHRNTLGAPPRLVRGPERKGGPPLRSQW